MGYRVTILSLVLLSGCHSYIDGLDPDGGEDAGVMFDLLGEEDFSQPPDLTPCEPQVTSCTGLCGPIYDSCLGKNVQCGACSGGQVCNLVTHTCETPKTSCAELGAECGITRNTCGTRLSCPDCPPGEECNPDTNTCVSCKNVSCEQLGYECGLVWLGCGPQSNYTDCGNCMQSGTTCNPYFNRCEPTCTPGTTEALCAAAKAERNVECGIISDGCGGYVDCGGCPAGQACGAQGEPNRCAPKEKPTECIAADRECGTISSVCGGTVNCGNCTPPDVCNQNGKCGAPCASKTCEQLGNPQCGIYDDGCGGSITCGGCPNANDYTCVAGMCCKKKTCAADYAGKCGTQLDDGCGGKLDCGCASGACTQTTPGMTGTCCVNTAMCPAGACNTTVTNACTGAQIPCTCPGNQYCDGNTCKPRKTCADFMANGLDGQPCSNGGAFDDGSGKLITCNCTGGRYCINGGPPGTVATGSQKGICCTDQGACNAGGMQACNTTRTNTCTGGTNTCGACSGGQCVSNVCQPLNTCSTYGANGQAGQPCSNGNAFPAGNGTNLRCPCSGGRLCVDAMGNVVSGANQGTCCQNTAVCPTGVCNPDPAPINTCTGQPMNCGCPSNQFCSGPNGTCQPKLNCNTVPGAPKGGAEGNKCNDNNYYDDGSGNKIKCQCSTSGGKTNNKCEGDSPTMEGTCVCTKKTCASCADDGKADGCGGTLSCKCPGSQVCFQNACCAPKSCQSLPAGVPAGSCGTFNNGCGASFSCACPTTHPTTGKPMPNMMCVPVPGSNPAYGTCTCTPTPCTVLGVGTHVNNGCGVPVTCTS